MAIDQLFKLLFKSLYYYNTFYAIYSIAECNLLLCYVYSAGKYTGNTIYCDIFIKPFQRY